MWGRGVCWDEGPVRTSMACRSPSRGAGGARELHQLAPLGTEGSQVPWFWPT